MDSLGNLAAQIRTEVLSGNHLLANRHLGNHRDLGTASRRASAITMADLVGPLRRSSRHRIRRRSKTAPQSSGKQNGLTIKMRPFSFTADFGGEAI